ncbi:Ribosomal protein methyltransferase [Arachis hypogaea]|nr:Ribosomal protein methyltransferase [Arachis hypogaea]
MIPSNFTMSTSNVMASLATDLLDITSGEFNLDLRLNGATWPLPVHQLAQESMDPNPVKSILKGEDINMSISHAADSIGLKEIPRYEVKIIEEDDWMKGDQDIQAMNIILNPRLAFGIRNHPTTKLCLLLLHDRIKGREYILDYGTGTEILAIAALKFGAAFAVGVDIDSQAIASASENTTLNNIRPDKLQLHLIASQTSSSCRDDWPSRVVEGENPFEIDRVTHKDKYDVF